MDWKTTLPAIVGGVVGILGALGVVIPQDVAQGIVAICLWILGLYATSRGVR